MDSMNGKGQRMDDGNDKNLLSLKALVKLLPHTSSGEPRHVGTAVMPDLLKNDPDYAKIVESEFDTVCVEHHLKWEPLLAPQTSAMKAGECVYDFTNADFIVDWALSKGLQVKGHTLVWHVTSPSFLKEKEPSELREAVRRHIHTTCGHFYSRIKSWDVVNEALAPDGSFAETMFTEKLPALEFIEDCFRWAKNADPMPRLLYNDNKVEDVKATKSNEMFEMLKLLKGRNTPLDGVGLQAHFDASGTGLKRPASPGALFLQIERLAELGLTVNISEMDVRIAKLSHVKPEARLLVQNDIYEKSLTACFRSPHFDGATFWGFTDKHTWCNDFYWPDSPLPWDVNYRKKPCYYGIANAIKNVLEEFAWSGSWVPESPKQQISPSKALSPSTDLPDWKVESST
jgi:endo-1,4-beta-xylanase